MSKIEKRIKTLTHLGLTVNQAKAYLALVKLGFASAKEISEISNIAQQDIYRVMPLLEKLGLVEKLVASPNLFKAILPEQALSVLLKCREKDTSILHGEALRLIEELNQNTENAANKQGASQFLIISGKNIILMRARKAITEASDNICVLTSWRNSAMNMQHFLAISKQALSRQVKIRFIFYMSEKEVAVFLKTMRHLMEDSRFKVRFIFSEKPVMFSVFGREQVFFPTKKDRLGNAPVLWSNNPIFIIFAQNYFDMLWEMAMEKPTFITGETVAV